MGCQEGHTAGSRTELGSLASQKDPRDPTLRPSRHLYLEWHPAPPRPHPHPPQAKPSGNLCGLRL